MPAGPDDQSVVIVVAVDPLPPGETLLSAAFVAAARLHGTGAIEDIALGPGSTAILMLSTVAAAHVSVSRIEDAVRDALEERRHSVARVEASVLASAPATIGAASDEWARTLGADTTVSSQRHAFRGAIRDLLKRRNLRTLFQPIVSVASSEIVGYEALSRGPAMHPLEAAGELLQAAAQAGLAREVNSTLAWFARVRARQRIDDGSLLLFINLDADNFHPSASHIVDWDSDRLWPLDNTVIELTERAPITDVANFARMRDSARERGVRFALDDAGAGNSSMSTLATLQPDFIKIDRSLTTGCDTDGVKRSMIAAFCHLAEQTGAEVIAEGVETVADLTTVRALGVELAQGYLFGFPDETPARIAAERQLSGSPHARRHRLRSHAAAVA